MARVVWDGAEGGDTLWWSSIAGSVTASTEQAYTGSYSYKITGANGSAVKNISAVGEFYLQARLYPSAGDYDFLRLYKGTTIIGSLFYRAATSQIVYFRGTTEITAGTITAPASAWSRVEWYWKIDDATGISTVLIDGVSAIAFTGDTKPGSDTTIDNIRAESGAGDTYYLDDIVLNNTTGPADNSYPNGKRIIAKRVNGAGVSAGWTPSAGANWQCVDEVPPDSDTTYVEADLGSGLTDLYALAAFDGFERRITRARVEVVAKGAVGGEALNIKLLSAGTEYDTAHMLTTNYQRLLSADYTTDPATAETWTPTTLNATEAGQEAP